MDYVVDERGAVETKTARVTRSNNDEFMQAAVAMLPLEKYEPARREGIAVRQIVQHHISAVLARSTNGRAPSKASGQIPSC